MIFDDARQAGLRPRLYEFDFDAFAFEQPSSRATSQGSEKMVPEISLMILAVRSSLKIERDRLTELVVAHAGETVFGIPVARM